MNLDGLIVAAGQGGDGGFDGYVQLYRDGSLAYVDKGLFDFSPRRVSGKGLVTRVLDAVERSVQAVQWAGASLPVVVQCSLHAVAGMKLATDRSEGALSVDVGAVRSGGAFERWVFDRDWIHLPEVVVDEQPEGRHQAAGMLRVTLDALWNAVGEASCEYFDEEGNWDAPWL